MSSEAEVGQERVVLVRDVHYFEDQDLLRIFGEDRQVYYIETPSRPDLQPGELAIVRASYKLDWRLKDDSTPLLWRWELV